ncbi:MAG: prepilin-type N-terminal cleavage/methylation domain-containing protein [Candidatus Rokubacteria bacterium]|nr:prepilin-type N-terminal cleavage/methylation domain-containing protein [Candidatus Rokubacteria bacterium]
MESWRDKRGLTLAELLVAVAVVGLLLAGALAIHTSGLQTYIAGATRVEAQQNARFALSRIARDIKTASQVLTAPLSPSDLQFSGLDAVGNAVTIRYRLVGSALERTEGVNPVETLIGGVKSLSFAYRDSTDAVTTTASAVRRVDVTLRTQSEQAEQASLPEAALSELTTTVRLRNAP